LIAYKFLRAGAVGPFSDFRWPVSADGRPGPWVAPGDPALCRRGVHACRVPDLPWWLATELWAVELAGPVATYAHKVSAPRGRLVRRIERWSPDVRREYVQTCAWRARDRALEALDRASGGAATERLAACATLEAVLDVSRPLADAVPAARVSLTMAADGALAALRDMPAMGAYVAAHAAGRIDGREGLAAERSWQGDWLRQRLELEDAR